MVGFDLVGGDHRRGFGDAIAFQQCRCRICGATRRGSRRAPARRRTPPGAGLSRSPGSPARAYWVMKVSVESRMVAPCSRMRRTISCGCSGVGWQTTFTPAISGSSDPHRQPEAMKGGQGIEQHVAGVEIDMGAHLRHIGQNIVVDSATPLGSPSVPEVNRIAAGLSGSRPAPPPGRGSEIARQRRAACRRATASRAHLPDRRTPRPARAAATSVLQLAQFDEAAGGDDALDLRRCASALLRPAAPEVKFSMVGTRP